MRTCIIKYSKKLPELSPKSCKNDVQIEAEIKISEKVEKIMTKLPPDKGKGDWLVKFILKHGLVHGAELGVQKGVNLKYLLDNVPHLKQNKLNMKDKGCPKINPPVGKTRCQQFF